MNELLSLSALELGAAIRAGEVSVPEAVETALAVMEQNAGNAFVTVDARGALERAEMLQKQAKKAQNPLFGIPMALKDNICTKSMPTTCASKMLARFRSPYDAEAAVRLQNMGAVCLGKTNMDEFGMGSTCETSFFGAVPNPWAEDRVAGGSSGGSAAAVARGCGWYALGSDTGGSIRLPAAHCGLTGIKPTYGTVSRYGLVAYASSFDQIGPVCRDAADCAAVLDAIRGRDLKDSTTVELAGGALLNGLNADVRGVRVGLAGLDEVSEPVRQSLLLTARVLRERGGFGGGVRTARRRICAERLLCDGLCPGQL